jgi:S-methylmethionine-dependent homocysteine/selenocysteine methylase
MKPYILDSALGTELENRGEYLPSFKTSIWSAYSLIHNPEIIKKIHIENIDCNNKTSVKDNQFS